MVSLLLRSTFDGGANLTGWSWTKAWKLESWLNDNRPRLRHTHWLKTSWCTLPAALPPCSALSLVSLLLGGIPFLMPPAWHFYHGLCIWTLGHASLTWHWREMHLCAGCSPICASKGCLKFRGVLFQSSKPSDSGNICLWEVLWKLLALVLDRNVSNPFCWGKGGYWGLTARLASENTSHKIPSLHPLPFQNVPIG